MTTSTATTEFDAREALRQFFEANALTAFNNCIELLKQRDFYMHALYKIEQGVDLENELPELKLVKKTTAKSICKQLAKNAEKKAIEAWGLNMNLAKTFQTHAKVFAEEFSLLPVFEIVYRSQKKYSAVNVIVKTCRRNLKVEIEGGDLDCENLHALIVIQNLKI